MSPTPQERPAPRPPAPLICPYCRDALGSEEPVLCVGCNTRYHAECTAELLHCGTLGCHLPLGPRPQRRRQRTQQALVAGLPPTGVALRDVPLHACADCTRDVRATNAVFCPSCLAPYHAGCAEDLKTCSSKGCEHTLPVKPAEWPVVLLGLAGLWAAILSYPVVRVYDHTTLADPLLRGLMAVTYVPLATTLPVFFAARRLRQASVRRVGNVAGAITVFGVFALAAVVLWTFGTTTASRLMAAVFGVTAFVTAVVLPSVAMNDDP